MDFLQSVVLAFQESPAFFLIYVTIIGFLVGSFLNVVIYRLPVMMENEFKDEYQEYFHPEQELPERPTFNLITPRSRCPNCGHKISAWENIPVISYLILKGRCHGCGQHISLRYPLVETFTGLMSLLVAWHFGPTVQVIGALLMTWSLIAISGIDFDKMLIPDEIVQPLLWIGILFNMFNTYVTLTDAVYGAVAAIAGSCIGTAAGLQIFPRIIYSCYKILYNMPSINTPFKPWYMFMCCFVSLLCICGAVLYSCMKARRSQPSQLMRPKAPQNGRRVLLERMGFVWKRLSFLSKVTVRNLLRYKKRFFMTIVGVAGCTALIITGFGLKHSISAIVDKQFGEVLLYDGTLVLNNQSFTRAQLDEKLARKKRLLHRLAPVAGDNNQTAT